MAENNERNVYTDDLSEILSRNRKKRANSDVGEYQYGDSPKNLSANSRFDGETVSFSKNEYDSANSSFGERDIHDLTDSDFAETMVVNSEYAEENAGQAAYTSVSSDTASFMEVNEDIHDIDFDDEPVKSKKTNKRIREAEKQLLKQSRAKRTVIQIILGLVVSGFVIFFGIRLGNFIYNAVIDYTGISNNEFQIVVELPENPSLDQVADVLKENGVISNEDFFKKYVEAKDDLEDFVGGEFVLSSSMNYSTIVSTLLASKNELITVEVTIIEGMTAYEVGQLLEENYVCRAEDFLKFYRDKMDVYDFELRLSEDSHKFNQMEGYLFPDKYEFYVNNKLKNHPDEEVDTTKDAEVAAKKIYSNFNSKITKTMYKRMHEMGLTLNELITLASMVQSEVSNVEDMKTVASVFLNRLRTGGEFSKLQSDVTVFYVQDYIEPYYKDYDLSTSLSVISNSYDTYECDGIPAGPICNPGMDAIGAVLDAYTTDYYYFCANEETGETYYGRTLEEHEANLVKAGLR